MKNQNKNSCMNILSEMLLAFLATALVVGLGYISGAFNTEASINLGVIIFIVLWIIFHYQRTHEKK